MNDLGEIKLPGLLQAHTTDRNVQADVIVEVKGEKKVYSLLKYSWNSLTNELQVMAQLRGFISEK